MITIFTRVVPYVCLSVRPPFSKSSETKQIITAGRVWVGLGDHFSVLFYGEELSIVIMRSKQGRKGENFSYLGDEIIKRRRIEKKDKGHQ